MRNVIRSLSLTVHRTDLLKQQVQLAVANEAKFYENSIPRVKQNDHTTPHSPLTGIYSNILHSPSEEDKRNWGITGLVSRLKRRNRPSRRARNADPTRTFLMTTKLINRMKEQEKWTWSSRWIRTLLRCLTTKNTTRWSSHRVLMAKSLENLENEPSIWISRCIRLCSSGRIRYRLFHSCKISRQQVI